MENILKDGEVYRLNCGGDFFCLGNENDVYRLKNLSSGWVLDAHNVQINDDGTIEWGYSTGGHFEFEDEGAEV